MLIVFIFPGFLMIYRTIFLIDLKGSWIFNIMVVGQSVVEFSGSSGSNRPGNQRRIATVLLAPNRTPEPRRPFALVTSLRESTRGKTNRVRYRLTRADAARSRPFRSISAVRKMITSMESGTNQRFRKTRNLFATFSQHSLMTSIHGFV